MVPLTPGTEKSTTCILCSATASCAATSHYRRSFVGVGRGIWAAREEQLAPVTGLDHVDIPPSVSQVGFRRYEILINRWPDTCGKLQQLPPHFGRIIGRRRKEAIRSSRGVVRHSCCIREGIPPGCPPITRRCYLSRHHVRAEGQQCSMLCIRRHRELLSTAACLVRGWRSQPRRFVGDRHPDR